RTGGITCDALRSSSSSSLTPSSPLRRSATTPNASTGNAANLRKPAWTRPRSMPPSSSPSRTGICTTAFTRAYHVVNMPLHDRRTVRLRGHDYTQPGAYFVTICTNDRFPLFGEIVDCEMRLSAFGKVAHEEWLQSARIRRDLTLVADDT